MNTQSESDVTLDIQAARAFARLRRLGFAVLAPDLTIRRVSDNLAAYLPEPADLITGRPFSEVMWEFAGLESALARVLSGAMPSFRLPLVNRVAQDGTPQYISFDVVPYVPEEPSAGLLVIVVDDTAAGELEQTLAQDRNELRLTRMRLAEANAELQRLSRLKSMYLAMAAHDMRSPLQVITSIHELLRMKGQGRMSADTIEWLDITDEQIDRLQRLLETLLDLEQIEQGTLVIQPVPCDLHALARRIIRSLDTPGLRGARSLVVELGDSPLMALADPSRVEQIIYNLVENALKYSPPDGSVRVGSGVTGRDIVLRVSNSGPELTPAQQASVFELFYRAGSTRGRGRGIGLYIVKMLVEAQGGRVTVDSGRGQGTTFSVYLPLANA